MRHSILRATPRQRRHLGYALGLSTVSSLAQYVNVLPIFRESLQKYLGIGDGRFGLIFSVGPLLGMASVLAAGMYLERWGPVAMIRWALSGTAAGMAVLAVAGGHWLPVLVGCALCAMAAGPLNIAVNAYLTRLFPRHRRRIISLNLAIGGAGSMAIPLAAEGSLWLAANVSRLTFGQIWRSAFAIVALFLLAVSWRYRGQGGRRRAGAEKATSIWRYIILPPPIFSLAFLVAAHGAVDNAIYIWLPRILSSSAFAHPLAAPGLVLSSFSLAYLVSRFLLSLVPAESGRKAFLIFPGLLGGGIFAAAIASGDARLAALGYVVGGFLWSAEYPALLSALAGLDQRRFGAAMALGQILGGPLTFALIAGTGSIAANIGEPRLGELLFALSSGFCLAGLGGALWLARFNRQDAAAAGDLRYAGWSEK